MKLIIDISEEDYKFIKEVQFYHSGRRSGKTIEQKVINAIKNGKPLPKGHGRLIDADALNFNADYNEPLISKLDFDQAPTIIEADVAVYLPKTQKR